MDGNKVTAVERELGRTASLVGEIVEGREGGNFEGTAGNADDDLLGAVEELEGAIRAWRHRGA
jgi:hypothetical protein